MDSIKKLSTIEAKPAYSRTINQNILIHDDHEDDLIQQIIEEYDIKDNNESNWQINAKENMATLYSNNNSK